MKVRQITDVISRVIARFRETLNQLKRRRVPVVLQMNAVECGAACLAMILSYYGQKTSVTDCRECFSIGRDGTSAQTIAKAARKFGLKVKAYSINNIEDFIYIQLPAIIHWNFNHFIVVERWSSRKIQVIDPVIGRRNLTIDEFKNSFTGVVLTFKSDAQYEISESSTRPVWRSYIRYLLQIPGLAKITTQILLASLLLQILGLVLPVFTKVVVDQVIPFRITNVIAFMGIGMVILTIARMTTAFLRSLLLIYLQGHLDSYVMVGFLEHLLALPFRFFQERSSGDLLMRLNSNVIIREILTIRTISTVLDGTLILVYLAILFTQNLLFGALVLGVGALQAIILLSMSSRVHSITGENLIAQAASQSYLVEALRGMETLKAAGAEEKTLEHWSNLFFKQLNVSLKQSQLTAVIETAMTALRTFSPLLLLWTGALLVLNNSMSLGMMLALNALAGAVLLPLSSLVSSGQQLQLVGAHLERISDVMESRVEQAVQKSKETHRITGQIELKHIHFKYSPDAPTVLNDVSVSIEPGQKVALVGRSGAGKTTLGLLLLGLYAPDKGTILFDDTPIEDMNYRALRSQFGVVLQTPYLFSGTIRQNITFNTPNISMEKIIEAAKQAVIYDDIMNMPMGFETPIAEGGSMLSGGQRKRIALARALILNPSILLLDEATSDLDEMTERHVIMNLNKLDCTQIVISHRLSAIRDADLILVFDQGRIISRGRHKDLIPSNGTYSRLVSNQLRTETV